MAAERWEFWIDVGGTFTDCLAKCPDGSIRRHKLLSSGVTKGSVAAGSTRDAIVDPARRDDPPDFWSGWQLVARRCEGEPIDTAIVTGFDACHGPLASSRPVEAPTRRHRVRAPLPRRSAGHCDPLPAWPPAVDRRFRRSSLRLGTTRGTNALITRSGRRTALVTTRGFGDVLEIGYQARPRLFDLDDSQAAAADVARLSKSMSA